MNFVTLETITRDLIDIIRGSQVAASEPISERQVEGWIHQYRAVLIKRDLDKKRHISQEYVQEIANIPVTASGTEYKTEDDIPNVIFRNFEDGYTWIGNGTDEYQYMNPMRASWQQHRKYSNAEPYVYLKEDAIYTNMNTPLTIRGLFENPMKAYNYYGQTANTSTPYPIPMSMIPTLKEMILKGELGIEADAPSDNTNDSSHGVSSNTER